MRELKSMNNDLKKPTNKTKILSDDETLKGLSEYRLKIMWNDGEIHKCSRCGKYHVKTDISWVKTNVSLCTSCQKAKDYYNQWKEEGEDNNAL